MQRLQDRLKSAVGQTFFAAVPIVRYKTTPIPTPPIKQLVSPYTKSNCIYQFTCKCQSTYIGRTERQLGNRVAEHIPKWLHSQLSDSSRVSRPLKKKEPASSIGRHLLSTGHIIDTASAFRVVYRTPNRKLLRFVEALTIKILKPKICKQLDFVVDVKLPWWVPWPRRDGSPNTNTMCRKKLHISVKFIQFYASMYINVSL